jgi:hypothetical protein
MGNGDIKVQKENKNQSLAMNYQISNKGLLSKISS